MEKKKDSGLHDVLSGLNKKDSNQMKQETVKIQFLGIGGEDE